MLINSESGVVVTTVISGSPADDILRRGDIIIEMDRRPVNTIDDYIKISELLKSRQKSILFRISRNGKKTFEVIKPR